MKTQQLKIGEIEIKFPNSLEMKPKLTTLEILVQRVFERDLFSWARDHRFKLILTENIVLDCSSRVKLKLKCILNGSEMHSNFSILNSPSHDFSSNF